ncbi:phosphatidylglycerophosphatase A [Candidatus Binatia bacterium]|nr:phosphatidylglycerophosphatase A [Candidatus Binatia bacterium]
MRNLVLAVASAGYIGYIPVASGTFGSLVGIPLFWWFDEVRATSAVLYVLLFLVAVALAVWVAGRADAYLGEHDSHKIVIDEVVGYLAATLFLAPNLTTALVAFLVFRVLDVIKPYPAGAIDARLPGGAGVVLDDVVSGVYTNLLIRVAMAVGLLA